jgi:hypothetical protein
MSLQLDGMVRCCSFRYQFKLPIGWRSHLKMPEMAVDVDACSMKYREPQFAFSRCRSRKMQFKKEHAACPFDWLM